MDMFQKVFEMKQDSIGVNNNTLTNNVKLLQKVVLAVGKEILMIKRSELEFTRKNMWDLPGGNSEWPRDTMKDIQDPHVSDWVREVREETGLILTNDQILKARLCHFGTYFENKKQRFAVIAGWTLTLDEKPKIKISLEHSEYGWFTTEEALKLPFGFPDQENNFIAQMIKGASK